MHKTVIYANMTFYDAFANKCVVYLYSVNVKDCTAEAQHECNNFNHYKAVTTYASVLSHENELIRPLWLLHTLHLLLLLLTLSRASSLGLLCSLSANDVSDRL